jgi:hypothetical protein
MTVLQKWIRQYRPKHSLNDKEFDSLHYQDYLAWCQENNHRPIREERFNTRIRILCDWGDNNPYMVDIR